MASPARVHRQTSEHVLSHLRSGVSVEIVGSPGSGRSALAEGVRRSLAKEGYQTLTVRGLFHLRDRPLESLYVSGAVEPPPASRVRSALASTVDSLAAVIARGPTMLLVDDLDDVDEATLGVLSAAHRRMGHPVLSVSRPSPRVPTGQPRPHSLAVRPGVQVRLPPLRFDDVHALVVEMLGGPVDPDTVRWVSRRSGGLAGLVLAVTDSARHDGSLVLRDGTWTVQHDRWSPLLSSVVDRMMEHTSPQALEGLHKLSLLGSCEHGTARRLVGTEVLEELDDRQLVHLVPTADRLVAAVYPPLVAEHFRSSRLSARRTRLLEEIAEVLPAQAPPPGAQHGPPPGASAGAGRGGSGAWASSGSTREPGARSGTGSGERSATRSSTGVLRPGPAEVSTRRSDTVLAQMLAEHRSAHVEELRSAWEACPSWGTATPYLRAVMLGGADPSTVGPVVDGTRDDGDVAALVAGTTWHACWLAVERHDLAAAVSLLTSLEPRAAARGASEDELWSLRLTRLRLESTLDRVSPEHSALLVQAGRASPSVRAAATVHRAELLVVAGRPQQALDLLDVETSDRDLAAHRDMVRGQALALSGDVDGALDWARQHMHEGRTTLSVDHLHAHAYAASVVLSVQGRTSELRENLSSALSLGGAPVTMRFFQAGNLSIAATVAMIDGRHATAAAFVDELEALALPSGNLPAMSAAWARARVAHLARTARSAVVSGLASTAGIAGTAASTGVGGAGAGPGSARGAEAPADLLWAETVRLLDRGFVSAGIFAGVTAVEIGPDPHRAQHLVTQAEQTDGTLLADLADYASAISSEDATRMVAVGDRLLAEDRPLYGLRAYTAAVRTWRSQGQLGRASAQFTAAQEVAAGLGPGYPECLDHFELGGDLTHREQEVARLVSQGWSNQEIADALVLSIRTVENHLHRAYRKVGVDNRQDLCAALTLDA